MLGMMDLNDLELLVLIAQRAERTPWTSRPQRNRFTPIVPMVVLLCLALLGGCGRGTAGGDADTTFEGYLLARDGDVWLVDTTLISTTGATIVNGPASPGARLTVAAAREGNALRARTITVGPVDPARLASRLPGAEVRGMVEPVDGASDRWRVGGHEVRIPPGTPGVADIRAGEQVQVQGYTLPDGMLLASAVTRLRQPPPAPTATPPPPPAKPAPARDDDDDKKKRDDDKKQDDEKKKQDDKKQDGVKKPDPGGKPGHGD